MLWQDPCWLNCFRTLFPIVIITFCCLCAASCETVYRDHCVLFFFFFFSPGCGSGGRASILLLEGHGFDSPGLHVKVSLGKVLNPKLLLMCWSWQQPPSVYEYMNYS